MEQASNLKTDVSGFFKGKKITVVGIGLLGGVNDICFLAENGADIIVTDIQTEEKLHSSLEILSKFPNIKYTLGRHEFSDFENRDLIIKAPAMPMDSPYLAHAKEHNIPITMWAALFSRFARQMGAVIIGITGTRGKSTTTALIADILKLAGKHVFLGGNVHGVATLAQLPEVVPGSIAVFELDSWKAQGFREEKISPHVAVFTTLYPDHLNYYHGDMKTYLADKAEIFLHQDTNDTLVLGEQCADKVLNEYGEYIIGNVVTARASDVPKNWVLKIPGVHNLANIACALAAARALDIEDVIIKKACEEFVGVEGRLQFLREINGVKIYNDTTATTPEATIAGLRALNETSTKNIILIMGGADKELNTSALMPEISRCCKKLVLLAGTGTEKFRTAAEEAKYSSISEARVFNSLSDAFETAMSAAADGDIVLFSPAFASFGMFKNEYDRGGQFVRIVNDFFKTGSKTV